VARIVAAHDALQFRKLADHVGEQIGLGQVRGALRRCRIGFQQPRNLASDLLDARDALQLAAELVVIHDVGETRHALLKPGLAILIEEEACVRQACVQHTFVAVNNLLRVCGLHVAHEQEIRQQLAAGVGEREIFLVLLHADNQTFLRHGEECLVEGPDQHHRMLDNARDLIHQFGALAKIPAHAFASLVRRGIERLGDDLAPRLKRSDDLALLFEGFRVILCVADGERAGAQEAVATSLIATLEAEH
jgi:hypothetical protein